MGRNPRSSATVYFRVDQAGAAPLQQQIYSGIRDAILAGSLTPGARLPSSRALADELGVSRTTVVFALWQLQAEGCVVSAGASGTFVARTLPDGPLRANRRRLRPRLSRIGMQLLEQPRVVERIQGPPRPFRIGTPALDQFPVTVWSRLAARRRRDTSAAHLDYSTPGGYRPLREAIAAHVAVTRGIRCSPDQVLIMAGAQHALSYASRLLLDAGDQAWLEEPGYFGARSALTGVGATIVPVPVDAQGINVALGERMAPDARLAFVAPSHQHPLGVCLTLSRRLALLRWATRNNAWVIEDDYDGEFRYQGRPMPALFGLDNDGCVIYVGSFSKTVFPSLRLGFAIVPDALVDPFLGARARFDCHPQTMDQVILTDFITEGHYARHVRRMRHLYAERHDALRRAAARFCGDSLVFGDSDTGLHLMADLRTLKNDSRVAREARDRGIEVAPLSHYYLGPATRPGLVLGFAAVDPPRIIAGMRTLAEAIRACHS